MTIVYRKKDEEVEKKECLIQGKFFYLSSLELKGDDKDYIRTRMMQGFLKGKFNQLHFFSNEETDGQTLNIENFRKFLFPDELNIDIQNKDWQFWVSLYEQAVQLDQECKKISEEQIQDVENNKEMNVIYMEGEIQGELAPFETIYRLLWLPRLAVSIDDLCKILKEDGDHESEVRELQELIDNINSDTAKRASKNAINDNNKKYTEGGRKRKYKHKVRCIIEYKKDHEDKIDAIYQLIEKITLDFSHAKRELNKVIYNISSAIYNSDSNYWKNITNKPHKSIEIAIKLYEAEKLFKRNFMKHKNLTRQDELITIIRESIDDLGLLNHLGKSSRSQKFNYFYDLCKN